MKAAVDLSVSLYRKTYVGLQCITIYLMIYSSFKKYFAVKEVHIQVNLNTGNSSFKWVTQPKFVFYKYVFVSMSHV